jgi:hypothetical protein
MATDKIFRIAQSVWQCECVIPDHLIDTVPASLGRTEGLKLPRCAQPQIGCTIYDRSGNEWRVINVKLFAKALADKKKGHMPIAVLELVKPA